MKVYVVTDSTSDTIVLGIYSHKEDAEKCFAEAFNQFGKEKDYYGTTLEKAIEQQFACFEVDEGKPTYIEIYEENLKNTY